MKFRKVPTKGEAPLYEVLAETAHAGNIPIGLVSKFTGEETLCGENGWYMKHRSYWFIVGSRYEYEFKTRKEAAAELHWEYTKKKVGGEI